MKQHVIRHAFHENPVIHDDVIKWKHFPRYWPFVRGIHRSPVNSPHKGQWRGALKFSLICARINSWVNNREAGDLRRHQAHCDVIVMSLTWSIHMQRRGWCTLITRHSTSRVYWAEEHIEARMKWPTIYSNIFPLTNTSICAWNVIEFVQLVFN